MISSKKILQKSCRDEEILMQTSSLSQKKRGDLCGRMVKHQKHEKAKRWVLRIITLFISRCFEKPLISSEELKRRIKLINTYPEESSELELSEQITKQEKPPEKSFRESHEESEFLEHVSEHENTSEELPQTEFEETTCSEAKDLLDYQFDNMNSIFSQYDLDTENPDFRKEIDKVFLSGAKIPDTMEIFNGDEQPDLGGFRAITPDSQAIVLLHEKLPGFVFKATQKTHRGSYRDNNLFRVPESRAMQQFITDKGLQHIVVPKKFLYLLPDRRKHQGRYTIDNYIVVAEKIDLIPMEENLVKLRNLSKDQIDEILQICFERGFHDIAWISHDGKLLGNADPNLRFTTDGKIAFIDTEVRTTYMHNWDPSVSESRRRKLNYELTTIDTSKALKYFVRPEMHDFIDTLIKKNYTERI